MPTRFPQILLGAAMLPWRKDCTLDEPVFRQHIRNIIQAGFEHVYLMGTAGEGYAVTDRQFQQVVKIFWEEMQGPGLHPMVGVISLSMAQIVERITWARQLGIRHFQISLPSWGVLTDAEMMAFFEGVCGAFPDCQFLHYNLPRTKRIVTGTEYRRLADAIPNLVATKNATSDFARVAELMTKAPDLQHVFVENAFAMGCLFGECSLLPSYGPVFPKLARRHLELGRTGQTHELLKIHKEVSQIVPKLFGHIEEPHIDGAYDKLFIWLRDPSFPFALLPPYRGFNEQQAKIAREAFETHYSGWE
ncbi:MAG: dihydrodipicolinate synthase family protein [Acidobacteria bacterium]|nr:dihydrodipicolinate synthase family protein [Acidobacteriota bacterium]